MVTDEELRNIGYIRHWWSLTICFRLNGSNVYVYFTFNSSLLVSHYFQKLFTQRISYITIFQYPIGSSMRRLKHGKISILEELFKMLRNLMNVFLYSGTAYGRISGERMFLIHLFFHLRFVVTHVPASCIYQVIPRHQSCLIDMLYNLWIVYWIAHYLLHAFFFNFPFFIFLIQLQLFLTARHLTV